MRLAIFHKNLKKIESHNELFKQGKKSYTLGVNQFADLTNTEFRKTYNGLRIKHRNSSADGVFTSSVSLSDLPDSVDWRTKGVVTPVKNQGGVSTSAIINDSIY